MAEIAERVACFMRKHDMAVVGDNIIIGFSGGADSVCLLFILSSLKKEVPEFASLNLCALHLNHMIRGEEARRDEDFARSFCDELGVPLTVVKKDVPAIAKETGESTEAAGRRIRYELFRNKLKDMGGGVIATAHHKNDSAESVLFNMARGTGLGGITGIAPKRDDIIRPLMCLTRAEIEDFVLGNGLEYMTDSTNADTAYTRNFIRHEVITPIEENINKNFVAHINSLSEIARKYKSYVDGHADEIIKKHSLKNERDLLIFRAQDIKVLPDILLETLIMRAYRQVSDDGLDLSRERIEAVADCIRADNAKSLTIEMAKGTEFCISENEAGFYGKEANKDKEPEPLFFMNEDVKGELEKKGIAKVIYDGYEITFKFVENFVKNDNGDYTKYFNYDKITSNTCFRRRLPGDVLYIDAEGSQKKLKKEFIDRKISERLRDRCVIMADGNHCMWAVGLRQSAGVFADEDSTVLEITVKETETDNI